MLEFHENEIFAENYLLKKYLGGGSFGDVWLGEYKGVDVAIKIYNQLDEQGVEDFLSEFKMSYSFNHTNLLHITNYDVYEGHPYLVMPYCSQGSAKKYLGRIDEATAWRFLRDVSSGLAYLHKLNPIVIHQDIKPDNILISTTGDFVITDFGISKRVRSSFNRSMRNISSGTRAYMGPERYSKTPTPVMASDVWSLGATLYELLTGDVPFGEIGGVMQKDGAEIPLIEGNYSEGLKQTIEKCLAKEPWNRPTAEQLSKYAQKIIDGETPTPWQNETQEQTTSNQNSGRTTERIDKQEQIVQEEPKNIVPSKKNKKPIWLWVSLLIVAIIVGGWLINNQIERKNERIAQEQKIEQERIAKEQERQRKAEQERIAQEQKIEQERIAQEQERQRKAEQERIAKEQERQRKAEQERQRIAEQERIAQEQERQRKAEQERIAQEQEQQRKSEQERIAQEREQQRKAEQERIAQEQERQRKAELQTITVNGVTFEMVAVEGGTFDMASYYKVTLTDYSIGKYEVTQELWQAVMGSTISQQRDKVDPDWPLIGDGDNYPMYYVSWEEVQQFITKLNQKTRRRFRLPTEAEWEFAARGGIKSNGYEYSGSNTIGNVAWYTANSFDKGSIHPDYGTHPVGQKLPNELGIYDMSGNVWEWCQDWFGDNIGDYNRDVQTNPTGPSSGLGRVVRGGSWSYFAGSCSVSYSQYYAPDYRSYNSGFRVVLLP